MAIQIRTLFVRLTMSAMLLALSACAGQQPPEPAPPPVASSAPHPSYSERGMASWYGPAHQGKTTASGEAFDQAALTAAHRNLPFGTVVEVTNLANGRSVKVRINDRGPFVRGRIVDLSKQAADDIGLTGTGRVKVEVYPSDQQTASVNPAPIASH